MSILESFSESIVVGHCVEWKCMILLTRMNNLRDVNERPTIYTYDAVTLRIKVGNVRSSIESDVPIFYYSRLCITAMDIVKRWEFVNLTYDISR